jgi:predicted ATP-grasp superfamily ATP-dependent carboligase
MTTSYKATVIVTYSRSLIALAIARSLAKRGVEVIGVDDVDLTVLSFSKWAVKTDRHAKKSEEEAFLADLERIIDENKPDDDRPYVLMPAFNDAEVIARHADRLASKIIVAAPSAESIAKIHPKDAFAHTVTELGVPAPRSIVAQSEDDLAQVDEEIGFPCIIKPADAVGGRGISKIASASQLRTAWTNLRDKFPGSPVVQELSEGDDYCYGFLAKDGRIIAEIAYRNEVSFPENFGAGVVRETVDPDRFRKAAELLVKDIGWTGIGQIDFMWTGEDSQLPQMIELNPRFWANLDHAISSGVDFPALWFELATTGEISGEAPVATVGHRSKLPGLWLLAAMERAKNATIHDSEGSAMERLLAVARSIPKLGDADSDIRKALSQLGKDVADLREVDTAGLEDDDPLVGLGGLFVLGSLIDHGELPPEVK